MKSNLLNLRFHLLKSFVPFLSLFLCQLLNSSTAASPSVNKSLLVGEWSNSGECEKSRFIYTADGEYMWVEKDGDEWHTVYNGIYLIKPEIPNTVVIAEGPNMGGDVIDIKELNRTNYKGEWNLEMSEGLNFDHPEDRIFSYVRCAGTAIPK